jgi:hypothetical protein
LHLVGVITDTIEAVDEAVGAAAHILHNQHGGGICGPNGTIKYCSHNTS